jgi:hypothetical protein
VKPEEPGAPNAPGLPASKPLSWYYARLKANEEAMLNFPDVQAFKEEWEKSPEGQAFKAQQKAKAQPPQVDLALPRPRHW